MLARYKSESNIEYSYLSTLNVDLLELSSRFLDIVLKGRQFCVNLKGVDWGGMTI